MLVLVAVRTISLAPANSYFREYVRITLERFPGMRCYEFETLGM